MKPLVSIIIPVYNSAKYISRAIRSAISQTHENIEILVVDDGSTDKTPEIVTVFEDNRIRLVCQEHKGQGAARNNGIRISQGQYLTFLDSDDLYMPDKIEKEVDFLEQNRDYHAVYCNALHFFSGKPDRLFRKRYECPSGDVFRRLLGSSFINPNTIMFRQWVIRDGFMFREDRGRYWTEEWDLFLRISRARYKFGYLNADLVIVEVRDDSNTTWDVQWLMKRNALEILESLFSQMSEEEKQLVRADKILRRQKMKLAIACLVSRDDRALSEALPQVMPEPFAWLVGAMARVMPFSIARNAIIRTWKIRQYRSFHPVSDISAIAAKTLLSQPIGVRK